MPAKRPQQKWLQLHVALAWVLTRHSAFTYQVKRFANPGLDNATALYKLGTDQVETVVENEATAWLRLREAIAKKLVRARGVPYDKDLLDQRARARLNKEDGPVLSKLEELELKLDRLDELHRLECGKAVAIPAFEVSALVVETDFRQMRLRPETVVFNEGRWWRDVIVIRDDLLKAFPVTLATPTGTQGRAHLLARTRQALNELYGPNGPAGVTEKRRFQEVNTWFFENAREQAKNPADVRMQDFVSRATIGRALKKIG